MSWHVEPVFIAQSSGPALCFSEYRVSGRHEVPRDKAIATAKLLQAAPDLRDVLESILKAWYVDNYRRDAFCELFADTFAHEIDKVLRSAGDIKHV